MKKKLIITENQLNRLKMSINENTAHTNIVKQMKQELDANYKPVDKFMREGGEYYKKPMIMVNIDEEIISPKDLYEYMKYKYKVNEEFIKQVISDWVYGKITDDYRLSKNVTIN